jgi:hypothetical protein
MSATRRRSWRVLCAAIGLALAGAPFAVASPIGLASKQLTVINTCVLTANPSTTTVAADSEVRQNSATTNFGTATSMGVASASAANRRAYVRFDLTRCVPSIPASASVKLATLRLFVTALPTACRTHDIFRVSSSWTETAITWNNQPPGTAINNPPTAQRTDSIDVGASPCQNSTNNRYVSGWDVTADVAAFVAASATNNGWMIRDDVEGSATARTGTYATKNLGTLARAPQLVVTYT